jgi:hypothetical protein
MKAPELRKCLDRAIQRVRVLDIHTHLYAPCFGGLLLRGIDELLTYHYLVAETFRHVEMPYADFFTLPKKDQADLVWKTLFVDRSPLSEATRGVLTTLDRLGLDAGRRDLRAARKFFAGLTPEKHVDLVFEAAGLAECVMTNDPFDDLERPVWEKSFRSDSRFKAALRIDPLLTAWEKAGPRLREWGYDAGLEFSDRTVEEARRFLRDWARRMKALYVAVSLTPGFAFPEDSATGTLIERAVLPVCEELGLPFALMIGVKRRVNPDLRLAGDGVGLSKVGAVEALCSRYPKNKFMVTMLARENQHELCVAARKFRNLLPFGCWWFLNNPSLIDEMTRMRLELLGPSVVPQHSDARVLDQAVYKWDHSRRIIGDVLFDKYSDLLEAGWVPTAPEIGRDVEQLFGGIFREFLKKAL